MKWLPCQKMIQCNFHNSLNTQSVNVSHGEVLYSQGFQNDTEREKERGVNICWIFLNAMKITASNRLKTTDNKCVLG